MIWFTSDTHYGHAGILRFSARPFADVTEMRERLITAWNARVLPGDHVYHLGDFAFCSPADSLLIAQRLLGQVHLLWGNHDKRLRRDQKFCAAFAWTGDYLEIKPGGQKIVLCHYPLASWNGMHRGSWHLHGHCHGSLRDPRAARLRRIDVGVDARPERDYAPWSLDEVTAAAGRLGFEPVDHHGNDPGIPARPRAS